MEKLLFNDNWLGCRGIPAHFETISFGDSSWENLTLPHDWCITQLFDAREGDGLQGYLPGGSYCYRKHFRIPEEYRSKRVWIAFDGIIMDSKVWCNGREIAGSRFGYLGYEAEITDLLSFSSENVIAVWSDSPRICARWYTGGGINRNVWLMTSPRSGHLSPYGGMVTTESLRGDRAELKLSIPTCGNGGSFISEIYSPDGKLLLSLRGASPAGENAETVIPFSLDGVQTWSPDTPALYLCKTLFRCGEESDRNEFSFGIRTVEFTKDRGMLLNHQPCGIRGLCHHQDLGSLGTAAWMEPTFRQLRILKELGCNAIRTAHHPFSPEFLDLCDQMGFFVMDEAFDEWEKAKVPFGRHCCFPLSAEQTLKQFVMRDRHHASVILWCIGNEIPEQKDPHGGEIARRLSAVVHAADPSRPVTAACESPLDAERNGMLDHLDVAGLNYNMEHYETFRGKYPLLGSETTASLGTRGEYLLHPDGAGKTWIPERDPVSAHQSSAYSVCCMGLWDMEDCIKIQRKSFWSAGEFAWCSFDYMGESYHGGDWSRRWWPSRSSYWGIHDTCGFPKDRAFLYKACWKSEPSAHLLPHWTHPGMEGYVIPVWCYTNAEEAELFLNGRSLGIRKFSETGKLHLEWNVPYEPGILRVEARKNGMCAAVDEIRTAGKPASIILQEESPLPDHGERFRFVRAVIADPDGETVPDADHLIEFSAEGSGILCRTDNGNAVDHTPFDSRFRRVFHGCALAVLRRTGQGAFTLKAETAGLPAAVLSIG